MESKCKTWAGPLKKLKSKTRKSIAKVTTMYLSKSTLSDTSFFSLHICTSALWFSFSQKSYFL